jgi:hypothetical protein
MAVTGLIQLSDDEKRVLVEPSNGCLRHARSCAGGTVRQAIACSVASRAIHIPDARARAR